MHLYEVLLGIDRVAEDSGQRMTLRVREADPLSAAIAAEALADKKLSAPLEYSHAMGVRCVKRSRNVIAFPRQPALMPAA